MHLFSQDVIVIDMFVYCLCVGEIKENCAVWEVQYSGWPIQHSGQSRGVKNEDYHRPCKQHISKQQ